MTLLNPQFDYSQIDITTATYLQRKEETMRQVVGHAYTELGKELKEAQDELSKKGYGCFEEWYTSLGFKKQSVYNYINRYELIVQQLDKRDVIEELPMNLAYEISKKSSDPQLTQKVLDGDIKTLNELNEVKQALKQEQEARQRAESESRHWQGVAKSAQNRPPQIVTQTVEKVPVAVEAELADLRFKAKQYKSGYEEAKAKLEQYELQDPNDFNEEQAEQQRKKLQFEADMNTLQLSIVFKTFIEKAALSPYLVGALATSNPFEKKRLQEQIEIAERIIRETKMAIQGRNLGGVVNE